MIITNLHSRFFALFAVLDFFPILIDQKFKNDPQSLEFLSIFLQVLFIFLFYTIGVRKVEPMMIPDMLQFIFMIAAFAFMSASTLFIFSGKKDSHDE